MEGSTRNNQKQNNKFVAEQLPEEMLHSHIGNSCFIMKFYALVLITPKVWARWNLISLDYACTSLYQRAIIRYP